VAEIEAAWCQPQEGWARRRLLVVRLIAQHELTVAQIMRVAEVSRLSVFTYRDDLVAGGVDALLSRKRAPGRKPTGFVNCCVGGWQACRANRTRKKIRPKRRPSRRNCPPG
jgi:hypothetical protein